MIKNDTVPVISKIIAAAAVLCSAVGSVLYGIAYATSYEADIRHYSADCVMIKVAFGLILLSAVLSVALGLTLTKKYVLGKAPQTQLESFTLWLAGFMFLGFAFAGILNGDPVESVSRFGSICIKAIPWLGLFSAAPFFLASSKRMSGSLLHGVSSMIPVLWAAAVMFKYYFDLHEVPLNDPELALTVASLSSVILFLLTECRLALGIAIPGALAFTSCLCVCVSGLASAVRIVLTFAVEGGVLIPTLMESIMMLTLASLALARLLSSAAALEPRSKESETETTKAPAQAEEPAEDENC